ncbi:MAG TPA: FAD-dependent thymidylate synthase [Bacillota bacterium]|nr:FAD-dependent thymidylate synthase [Bacillota bacterium]
MQTGLNFRIINYPFMGTGVNTERLMLMAKLCYSPIGADRIADMVTGEDGTVSDDEAGRFVRGLISSGHMGALEHWYTSFAVEGYSRVSSQQNDRHRIMKMFKDHGCAVGYVCDPEQGCADTSQLQQSQRYVKEEDFNYVVPPSVKAHAGFYEKFVKLQEEVQALQDYGLNEAGLPAEDVRFALTNATETRFVITTNARQLRHMFNLRCCARAQWEIRALFDGLLEEYRKIAPNVFWRAGASCDEYGYCPEGAMSCGKAPTLKKLKEMAGLR